MGVTTTREDGSLDLKAMVDKTQEEMAKGTEVICEASFTFDGNYCAVDVLKKTETGWAIYEVKSSSFPESKVEKAKKIINSDVEPAEDLSESCQKKHYACADKSAD